MVPADDDVVAVDVVDVGAAEAALLVTVAVLVVAAGAVVLADGGGGWAWSEARVASTVGL